MKVIFLKEFSKDLDGISFKSVKLSLKRVIERMETTDALSKAPNTKKNFKGTKQSIEQE